MKHYSKWFTNLMNSEPQTDKEKMQTERISSCMFIRSTSGREWFSSRRRWMWAAVWTLYLERLREAAFKHSRSPRSDPHSHITADLFRPLPRLRLKQPALHVHLVIQQAVDHVPSDAHYHKITLFRAIHDSWFYMIP